MKAARFSFLEHKGMDGSTELIPLMPLRLTLNERQLDVVGLLDTAASVSVLPFSAGLALGAVWEQQSVQLDLVGNLANFEARALLLTGSIEGFPPVRLAFAWTKADNVPLLLGQTNFFMEFDVFFSRSAMFFEVMPKGMNL